MGETLISRRRVEDEGLRVVNSFYKGISPAFSGHNFDQGRFGLRLEKAGLTVPYE